MRSAVDVCSGGKAEKGKARCNARRKPGQRSLSLQLLLAEHESAETVTVFPITIVSDFSGCDVVCPRPNAARQMAAAAAAAFARRIHRGNQLRLRGLAATSTFRVPDIRMECGVDCDVDEFRLPFPADEASPLHDLGTEIWETASGRALRHVVYSLIGCPGVLSATYILVRRSPDGLRDVLAVRRTRSNIPSLNLARIRRLGARLGANEVHVFRDSTSDEERRWLVSELSRSLGLRRNSRRRHLTA